MGWLGGITFRFGVNGPVKLVQKFVKMSGCDDYIHAFVADDFYDIGGRSTELDTPVEQDIAAGAVSGFHDMLQRYIEGERSAQLYPQAVFVYSEAAGDNGGKKQHHENGDGE